MDEPTAQAPRTLADLKREHGFLVGSRSQAAQGEGLEQSPFRNYIRDLVLGYNDGVVSVYAVTAGVAGAAFATPQILVTGIAAAIAGALSMAAGEYISTKSQAEFYRAERIREEEHLERWPQLEEQELRESLEEKGIQPPLLEEVVKSISSDRKRFLDYMMRDEFGVGKESERSPWRAAGLVLFAFLLGAVFVVAPYGFMGDRALVASSAFSVGALFLAGFIRARASRLPGLRSGLEMVAIGAIAAGITYWIGRAVGVGI